MNERQSLELHKKDAEKTLKNLTTSKCNIFYGGHSWESVVEYRKNALERLISSISNDLNESLT